MRTDATPIPAGTRPNSMEPFDAPPGEWLASGRAMWELAKWLVSRDRRMASMLIFFVVPGGNAGIFMGGFLAVLWSALILGRVSKKEAGAALAMLPLSSRQKANLIWFITVSLAPLLYAAFQFLVRTAALVIGEGSWQWIAQVVPESVIAMGLATVIPFATWLSPREDSPSDAWSGLTSIRGWLSTFAFVGAIVAGWIFMRSETGLFLAYAGMVCVSTVLVALSYLLAPQVLGLGTMRLAPALAFPTFVFGRGSYKRRSAFMFFGLWLDCLVSANLCVIGVAVLIPVYAHFKTVVFDYDARTFDLFLPFVLVLTYTVRFKDMDYRVIRCLPLRRSRQALLVLSLVLPFVLPVLAALVAASLYLGWPVANTAACVAALGGCCAVALPLIKTIGQHSGGIIGGILAMPLALAFWHWQSPWAMGFYIPYTILLWFGAYAYLYQNLCGDGSLYNKTDDFADMMLGRG
ncbi:MAG: hypothetical protein KJ060_16395 [Candidatus Hydrogenedentes bacterium]|nr:hypothetical protein [Candidatus Hydrogenedentota bacterium]